MLMGSDNVQKESYSVPKASIFNKRLITQILMKIKDCIQVINYI